MSRSFALCTAIVLTVAVARAHDPITTRVTWNREISPIVEARCTSCHSRGGSAPMPLTTYEEARPWARAIKEAALVRHMPNWKAARGYGDFLDDPSLSPFEIALIAAWVDGGAPQGSGNQNRGPQPTVRLGLRRPGRVVTIACADTALPTGRLLGVRPTLAKSESVGIAVQLPDGRRELLAWIRDYDPRYPTFYWLRTPLRLPAGSRLVAEGPRACTIDVTLTARR